MGRSLRMVEVLALRELRLRTRGRNERVKTLANQTRGDAGRIAGFRSAKTTTTISNTNRGSGLWVLTKQIESLPFLASWIPYSIRSGCVFALIPRSKVQQLVVL